MANEAVVMLPEAPAGWRWISIPSGPVCERKYGPATARVAQSATGSWRSWACAYHPDAKRNFITAHNQEVSCSEFKIAIKYAEEAGQALEGWIAAPITTKQRDEALAENDALRVAARAVVEMIDQRRVSLYGAADAFMENIRHLRSALARE